MKNLSTSLVAGLAVILVSACGQKTEDPAPVVDKVGAPEAAAPADTGGMILPATTESSDARAHYMAGWASFENSRLNAAHSQFLEAAAADPGFAMGHLMAALSAPSTEAFVTNLGLATA